MWTLFHENHHAGFVEFVSKGCRSRHADDDADTDARERDAAISAPRLRKTSGRKRHRNQHRHSYASTFTEILIDSVSTWHYLVSCLLW